MLDLRPYYKTSRVCNPLSQTVSHSVLLSFPLLLHVLPFPLLLLLPVFFFFAFHFCRCRLAHSLSFFFSFFSKLALTQFHFPLFLVASLFFPPHLSVFYFLQGHLQRSKWERMEKKQKKTKKTTIFYFHQAPPRLPLGEYLAPVSEWSAWCKDALLARVCDCCVVCARKKN